MDRHIYVLTDPDKKALGKYKVGIHKGDYKSLISRYVTYLPNVQVLLFMSDDKCRNIETQIKKDLASFREENINGNDSEWYQCDLATILHKLTCLQQSVNRAKTQQEKVLTEPPMIFPKKVGGIEMPQLSSEEFGRKYIFNKNQRITDEMLPGFKWW